MANIQTSLKNWSTTEASNQPDTADTQGMVGDLRAIQAGVRYLRSQDTIASATTCDLGTKDAESLTITGTTTITGLGTVSAGIIKRVVFSGVLTLTHNGTSLILPGGASITTAANDSAEFESLGSGNWRCIRYQKASGAAVVGGAATGANGDITSLTALTAITTTGGVDIKGTNTNDSAASGDVGEYIESIVLLGSAVSLTTGVTANVTSISLTAGDWDVWGNVGFNPGGTTNIASMSGGIGTTSATLPTAGNPGRVNLNFTNPTGAASLFHVGTVRVSVASTTTCYLIASSSFTVSTNAAYGHIAARRRR